MSNYEEYRRYMESTINEISKDLLKIHPDYQTRFLRDLRYEINKLLVMYPE